MGIEATGMSCISNIPYVMNTTEHDIATRNTLLLQIWCFVSLSNDYVGSSLVSGMTYWCIPARHCRQYRGKQTGNYAILPKNHVRTLVDAQQIVNPWARFPSNCQPRLFVFLCVTILQHQHSRLRPFHSCGSCFFSPLHWLSRRARCFRRGDHMFALQVAQGGKNVKE